MAINRSFQLKGTNAEKAKQLITKMNQDSLSEEILNAILPHEKEFYKTLVEMFRDQINAESNDHKIYLETINNIAANLTGILPNEKLDSETRNQITQLISKITDDLKDIKNEKDDKSKKVKQTLIISVATTFVLGIASWLIFGNGNEANDIRPIRIKHK